MRIVADENIEMPIISYLRQQGHQVVAIAEEHSGISEEQVLSRATTEQAILLTSDHDFGQMIITVLSTIWHYHDKIVRYSCCS